MMICSGTPFWAGAAAACFVRPEGEEKFPAGNEGIQFE